MLAPWSTDVWATPALHRDRLADRRMGWLAVSAHLKNGVTLRQAGIAMNSLDAELARQHPDPQRPAHDPLRVERRSGLSGSPVWSVFLAMSVLLMAVVGIIYLIACANVGGLLIARAAARRREILIRLSLGASRACLVRQLLTESLLLGLLGAAAGIAMAFGAGNALAALMPSSISGGFRFQHSIDLLVLAWTLALAAASVLLAGLLPALRASDQNLATAGRTHSPAGGRTPRLRQWLIVAQVAASVLVLATAGIFIRNFQKSQQRDPGFDAAHLLTVDLNLGDLQFSRDQAREFYLQAKSRVSGLAGVDAASLADVLPLGNQRAVAVPQLGDVATATVDPAYFRTMGIPLLRGREPRPEESSVAIVNQALAARLWPGQDPIGKSLRVGRAQSQQQVIGVTATGKYWTLTEPPRPFLYQFSAQFDRPFAGLEIRTRGPSGNLAAQVSQEIQRLNPDLPVIAAETGQERLRIWLEPQRAAALLLGVLGLAALALAITGLYALLAQLLVERTPEIAVRVALGASRRAVLVLLLRQSAIVIAAGTAAGIAASAVVARLLAAVGGPLGSLDPPALFAIVVLLATVGAAATALPAYRALHIDPASALRSE
jgi:predicted permease